MRLEAMTAKVARSREELAVIERARERALLPLERAEAIWGLVCDLIALREGDGTELRLDRSLARVKRGGR